MRIPTLIAVAAVLALAGCTSSPTLSDLACADDDCPPAEDIHLPGHQVPVYETICDPIYEERREPIWGEKTVPVFQTRRVPVTITVKDHCGCDQVIKLWDREEKVQVGVRRVRACIGYRTEKVQVGSCPRRILRGWRTVGDPCAP